MINACQQLYYLIKTIVIFPVYILIHLIDSRLDIWIIGENTGKSLGDNGFVFYNYCRDNYPERCIYFVANKKYKFPITRINDPNILDYASFRHILKFLQASTCIYSHVHSDIAYKKIFKLFKGKKTSKIFLQHGIIGFKRLNGIYNKKSNQMNIFIVSSEYEKKIVKENFDFDQEAIKITGLARYDRLDTNQRTVKKKLLYIPTWRKSTRNRENYTNNVSSLLTNTALDKILSKYNYTLTVYAHERMKDCLCRITSPASINVVEPGVRTVQELLLEHSLMITDYSSVAWDFLYLDRPVLFYQFDQAAYLKEWGSYLDLNNDLFGELCFREEDLVSSLEKYLVNECTVLPEYSHLRDKYFKYHDTNNCQRIFEEIEAYNKKSR